VAENSNIAVSDLGHNCTIRVLLAGENPHISKE
jgi:hypothetical protein